MKVTDGRQLKAGRIILGLTVRALADAAGINRNTVLRVEAQRTLPKDTYGADMIQNMLESAGIVFDVADGYAYVSFPASQRRKRCNYTKRG